MLGPGDSSLTPEGWQLSPRGSRWSLDLGVRPPELEKSTSVVCKPPSLCSVTAGCAEPRHCHVFHRPTSLSLLVRGTNTRVCSFGSFSLHQMRLISSSTCPVQLWTHLSSLWVPSSVHCDLLYRCRWNSVALMVITGSYDPRWLLKVSH